jgi:hypothetical protein
MNAALNKPIQANPVFEPGLNKVGFESEGRMFVGNLFLPPDYRIGNKPAGIIVGGSWTVLKEQMDRLFAQCLTRHGFAVLSFEHRYYDESDGEPREWKSPAAKIEDFTNATAFIRTLPVVNAQRVGVLDLRAGGDHSEAATETDWFTVLVSVSALAGTRALYWSRGARIDFYDHRLWVSEAVIVIARWFDKHLNAKREQYGHDKNTACFASEAVTRMPPS